MTGPQIGLIWAQATGGVIGRDGVMPWHLPEDLAHFKELTTGNPIIMGRKTWDSLPERFRPLPERRNIVVTRQPYWSADGAEVAHSFEEALSMAQQPAAEPGAAEPQAPERIWVIGGAEIFTQAIDRAEFLAVTEIRAAIAGDTIAPPIDDRWVLSSSDPETGWFEARTGLAYRFRRYRRAG